MQTLQFQRKPGHDSVLRKSEGEENPREFGNFGMCMSDLQSQNFDLDNEWERGEGDSPGSSCMEPTKTNKHN